MGLGKILHMNWVLPLERKEIKGTPEGKQNMDLFSSLFICYILYIHIYIYIYVIYNICYMLSGLAGKESACNAGDSEAVGSITESGRSPGGGNGNPFRYSCLENPMDRRAW